MDDKSIKTTRVLSQIVFHVMTGWFHYGLESLFDISKPPKPLFCHREIV